MPVNLKFRMANFKLKCKFKHMKDQDNEYENCDPKFCQTWCHHMLMHFSIKHWLQHRCIQVLAIGTKKVQVIHLNTSGSFWLVVTYIWSFCWLGTSWIQQSHHWREEVKSTLSDVWETRLSDHLTTPQNHRVGKIGAIGSHTMIRHVNIMTALKRLLTCKAYWCLYM